MSLSLYATSVTPMIAMLGSLSAWLDKAAAEKEEVALMKASLHPDMYALARQVQIASDTAKGVIARVTGTTAPSMPDTEASFTELKERCAKTISYLESISADEFDAGASRSVTITFPNGGGLKFDTASEYVNRFALPNFYFHATCAYAILRKEGVGIGKQDYLSSLGSYMFAPPQPA